MRVLVDNYNSIKETVKIKQTSYPRTFMCERCESKLEYEKSDMRMGEYGCMHIKCPLCDYDNMLEDNEENIILTANNIEFPTHFHHISKENGDFDCCNNEMVREYIYKAIEYFRANKEDYSWGCHITGNFYIHVHRGNEKYNVTLSNNFYSMDIPFEEVDY